MQKKEKYGSTYLHILQLHLSQFQAFMPFLNLNTFSTLFIVSGLEFQRMLPRNARDFMPKDIVLVGGIVVCGTRLASSFSNPQAEFAV